MKKSVHLFGSSDTRISRYKVQET